MNETEIAAAVSAAAATGVHVGLVLGLRIAGMLFSGLALVVVQCASPDGARACRPPCSRAFGDVSERAVALAYVRTTVFLLAGATVLFVASFSIQHAYVHPPAFDAAYRRAVSVDHSSFPFIAFAIYACAMVMAGIAARARGLTLRHVLFDDEPPTPAAAETPAAEPPKELP